MIRFVGSISLQIVYVAPFSLAEFVTEPINVKGGIMSEQKNGMRVRWPGAAIPADKFRADVNTGVILGSMDGNVSFTTIISNEREFDYPGWHYQVALIGDKTSRAEARKVPIFHNASLTVESGGGASTMGEASAMASADLQAQLNRLATLMPESPYVFKNSHTNITSLTFEPDVLSSSIKTIDGAEPPLAAIKVDVQPLRTLVDERLKYHYRLGYPNSADPKVEAATSHPGGYYKHYAFQVGTIVFKGDRTATEYMDVPLWYDDVEQVLIISPKLLGSTDEQWRLDMFDEAELLKQAAIDRASGIDTSIPATSSVTTTPGLSSLAVTRIEEWRLQYSKAAAAVNAGPVEDVLTPYFESTGTPPADIPAKIEAMKGNTDKPGSTGWQSIWETLSKAGSAVGGYIGKWSPLDWVAGYAGVTAVREAKDNKWLWIVAAIAAVAILK